MDNICIQDKCKKSFKVVSVNVSDVKGVIKHPVDSIVIDSKGVIGDAHSGDWHRQISLLAKESIEKAEAQAGRTFPSGTFAENITTVGMELHKLQIQDRISCGDILLEVSQIGKKCHAKCEIGRLIGHCIMPLEGIFCKVIKGGHIEPEDEFIIREK